MIKWESKQSGAGLGARRLARVVATLTTLVGIALGTALGQSGGGANPSTKFPLRVSPDRHYLVDQAGQPFLLMGDSPWEIFWNLPSRDAEEYLENRRQKGFNAILVDVLPYSDWSNAMLETDREGNRPFLKVEDFSTPNEPYFHHIEWVVQIAQQKGMLVMMDPAFLGGKGMNVPQWGLVDGMWAHAVRANGPEKCLQYGRYLGQRFGKYPNILWDLGADRDPEDTLREQEAMARGLHETAPQQLRTYQAAAKPSSLFPAISAWVDVNNVYTYDDVYSYVAADYQRTPAKPTFLLETGYEGTSNDGRGGTPHRVRRQAWWAMLSGGCGQVYGSAGWDLRPGWWSWMESPGVRQMVFWRQFFQTVPWHRLVPDLQHTLLVEGYGAGRDTATTASLPDGSLAVSYLPSARPATVDMSRFSGPVRARWFDPTDGTYKPAAEELIPNRGTHNFRTPSENYALSSDFVLRLEVPHPGAATQTQ
jgi:hypothetical protein